MGDFGFWALAHEQPGKLALVEALLRFGGPAELKTPMQKAKAFFFDKKKQKTLGLA